MNNIDKQKLQEIKAFAKFLAVMGVRNNTDLEVLHSGISPKSSTGDYSDVEVIYPEGKIKWNDLSRISDKEMRLLMLSVERALEKTLIAYEKADGKMKKEMLKFAESQRSYDCDDI